MCIKCCQDAGQLNKRNSQIMSEDFDIFSITPPAADQKPGQGEDKRSEGGKISLRPPPQTQQKRFSTHLAPSDALPRNNTRFVENMRRQYQTLNTLPQIPSPQE